jgi:hypothetical protein
VLAQLGYWFPNYSLANSAIAGKIDMYSLLTFGSLLFMVAGLYLPQLLKLKVGGIELEKSSLDQSTPAGPIGIRR